MENQALELVIGWIHLLATVAWIGGMFANFFIYLPAMGSVLDPPVAGKLMGTVMKRYRVLVYLSMSVLLLTGVFLALSGEGSEGYSVLESNRNVILLVKMILFMLMVALAVYAFEVLAPSVARQAAKGPSPELARKQRSQKGLAMAGFILGILILALSKAL